MNQLYNTSDLYRGEYLVNEENQISRRNGILINYNDDFYDLIADTAIPKENIVEGTLHKFKSQDEYIDLEAIIHIFIQLQKYYGYYYDEQEIYEASLRKNKPSTKSNLDENKQKTKKHSFLSRFRKQKTIG